MQVKKQQLELDMEQQTGSKLGKEYIKAVYCYPAYLSSLKSISCEVLGWMKHKLESRLLGEISITSDMQMTPPFMAEGEEELKSLLMIGCILSPCLFNFYAEYIMRKAGLEEAQAGIKTARINLNNLRYADDTTLKAESEEELKSLLMKVKVESEKVGLKLNSQKTKIMASGPITSRQIDGETVETVADCFSGLQNHCRW